MSCVQVVPPFVVLMTPRRFEEVVLLSAMAAYTAAFAPVLVGLGKIANVMRPSFEAGVPAGRICAVNVIEQEDTTAEDL